jgi:hypothetical protein
MMYSTRKFWFALAVIAVVLIAAQKMPVRGITRRAEGLWRSAGRIAVEGFSLLRKGFK